MLTTYRQVKKWMDESTYKFVPDKSFIKYAEKFEQNLKDNPDKETCPITEYYGYLSKSTSLSDYCKLKIIEEWLDKEIKEGDDVVMYSSEGLLYSDSSGWFGKVISVQDKFIKVESKSRFSDPDYIQVFYRYTKGSNKASTCKNDYDTASTKIIKCCKETLDVIMKKDIAIMLSNVCFHGFSKEALQSIMKNVMTEYVNDTDNSFQREERDLSRLKKEIENVDALRKSDWAKIIKGVKK
jgi:hypothetical protein